MACSFGSEKMMSSEMKMSVICSRAVRCGEEFHYREMMFRGGIGKYVKG